MDDSAKLLLGLLIGGAVTHAVYASGQSSSSQEPSMAGHAATRPRRRRPPSATVPPVLVEAMREVNGLAAQIARQEVEKHVRKGIRDTLRGFGAGAVVVEGEEEL